MKVLDVINIYSGASFWVVGGIPKNSAASGSLLDVI